MSRLPNSTFESRSAASKSLSQRLRTVAVFDMTRSALQVDEAVDSPSIASILNKRTLFRVLKVDGAIVWRQRGRRHQRLIKANASPLTKNKAAIVRRSSSINSIVVKVDVAIVCSSSGLHPQHHHHQCFGKQYSFLRAERTH